MSDPMPGISFLEALTLIRYEPTAGARPITWRAYNNYLVWWSNDKHAWVIRSSLTDYRPEVYKTPDLNELLIPWEVKCLEDFYSKKDST